MPNVIQKINALKTRLEAHEGLRNFYLSKFSKEVTVRKVFKRKTEIRLDDFPIIMITRPRKNYLFAGEVWKKENVVLLYAGYRQEDMETALDNFIELEDLLEEAVNTRATGDVPMVVVPGDSENDEGMFHPVYFMVKQITIKDR
jgi:hypothetical protein